MKPLRPGAFFGAREPTVRESRVWKGKGTLPAYFILILGTTEYRIPLPVSHLIPLLPVILPLEVSLILESRSPPLQFSISQIADNATGEIRALQNERDSFDIFAI